MIQEAYKPETIEEAGSLKKQNEENILFLAGGTEINSLDFKNKPGKVILLSDLKLNSIEKNGDEIIIGSCVTIQELIDSDIVPEILKKAAAHIVNRNIRNIATIGGNIGSNKSCSNLLPALIVLSAQLEILEDGNKREIDVFEYITEERDDLILNIKITHDKNKCYNIKKISRTANDISIIITAVSCNKNGDTVAEPIIAVGGLSKHTTRLIGLEERLEEKNELSQKEIYDFIDENTEPISDLRGSAEYKKYIASVLLAQCISCCGGK